MLLEISIIIALLAGIIAGTLTGLSPGIHINLVSAFVVSFSAVLLAEYSIVPLALVVFLVAMAITHTFVDYVPSIYLGAPDEDNFLSILPGHEMLMKGEAHSAVVYTLYGSASALLIILLFTPLFIYLLPIIYPYAQKIMAVILLVASGFLVYFEKNSRLWALLIFLLSGFLGMATFSLPIKENLLPLFTGLFGVSSLITSISKKQRIPSQKIYPVKKIQLPITSFLKSLIASAVASPICSFLPGMGSGQAAVVGSEVMGDLNKKEFLVLLGAINTIVTGLSFIALYSINKARSGVAVAIGQITDLSYSNLWIIIGAMIFSGVLAFFLTLFISKKFAVLVSRMNYKYISLAVIGVLLLVNFYFSGWLGLLVLSVSTILGILCIYSGVRRTHMLGSLLIPTIFFYLI